MTDQRLQAIKARAAAATEGPWSAYGSGVRNGDHWYVFSDDGEALAHISSQDGINEDQRQPDAEFISHSRADVEWLVQQFERFTDMVAEFRKREESQDRIRERLTAERDKWRIEALRLSTEANRWRDQAKEYQARLDAVTALLDQWEREAGPDSNAWAVYGPQKLSTPFAVNQLRAALNGDPDAMSMAEAQRRIDSGEMAVWCWCWGGPEPDGRWIYPNETCADVCHNEHGGA